MDYCKLLVIASLLFFGGVMGQLRFQRHLGTTATTQNGMEQGVTGMNRLNRDGELTYDNGDVVLQEPHVIVDVELSSDSKLRFEVCSDGCTNTEVIVCYDAVPGKIKSEAKVGCGENQCGIKAGIKKEDGQNVFYFMTIEQLLTSGEICEQSAMKYPKANIQSSETQVIDSCDPVKRDGNVVRLHVQNASPECPIKVKNAKRWFPTTTALPTTAPPPPLLLTPVSSSNTTGSSSSSDANTTWWIVCGVLVGFLVLLIIGVIGFCVYRHHTQKKTAAEKEKADRKSRVMSPESLPTLDLTPNVQKEEEKPKKEEIKKDKTEQKKKQKKVENAPVPAKVMPSKEATTEDQPKVEASKEQAAPAIKEVQKEEKVAAEVQKEKKAPAAKECSKKAKKHVKKGVVVPVAPPPPPRPKAATPKQKSVDATQEESPSTGRQQDALEEGSTSPSIEKKKAPPKKPAKKMPPPRSPHRRQRSKKARLRSYLDTPQSDMSTEEWKEIQEQRRRRPGKLIEWNPSARSSYK